MRRKRGWSPLMLFVAAVAIGVPAPAGGASGQGAATQPPGGEMVVLAYKFKPNRVTRQQVRVKGDLAMAMGGQAGQNMPILMDITLIITKKVIGIGPDGEATLSATLTSMDMRMNAMGQDIQMKAASGKVTTLMNGQPMPGGAAGVPGLGDMFGKSMTMRVSPRGRVRDFKAPGMAGMENIPGLNMGQLFSGASPGFSLPEHPVAVGESWEDKATVPLPLPGAATPLEMQLTSSNTLKALETRGGKKIAVIETQGKIGIAGAAAAGSGKFNQNFTMTNEFDVAGGESLKANGQMNLELDISSLMGAAGQGAAPAGLPSMTMKGSIEIAVNSLPAARPTRRLRPAPARKPPARRPPARRI